MCYIDHLISLGNSNFASYIKTIYPKELELKETTDSVNSCSYLDLFLFRGEMIVLKVKFMTKKRIYLSKLLIIHFWIVIYLFDLHMVFMFLGLSVLLVHALICQILLQGIIYLSINLLLKAMK